ncbi:uncharacterized protein PAC_04958 [Phialocephala subalpina]|uniref:Xylanolytic transcriptional activator regulatory domain-containing protein n=1 Tax=Phialocephala subalpina TaxID=576137 RepID=A0A1L7WQM6_9HELO|nr:uncharacterized protein PAC_04958 [Phialocephala subalpina]
MRRLAHLEKLKPEDLEVRKRLFLAAYSWDKSISICLGRPPSLTEMPYTPGSLSVIELEEKIRAFYKSLPHDLRIENVSSMQFCPPPHIFSLNILHHVSLILLYRPVFFASMAAQDENHDFYHRAHRISVDETSKINEVLKAHHRTFNFRIQTYLVSYCVYTAATIDVCEIKNQDDTAAAAAAERLSITVNMLESEARQTPGIKRSIEIVKTQLRTHTEPSDPSRDRLQTNKRLKTAQKDINPEYDALILHVLSSLTSDSRLSSQTVARNGVLTTHAQEATPQAQAPFSSTNRQSSFNFEHPKNFNRVEYSEDHQVDHAPQHQPVQPLASIDERSQFGLDFNATNQDLLDPGIWNPSGGFVPSVLNWNMQDMDEDAGFDVDTFWSLTT